jgi:hypothetical protein
VFLVVAGVSEFMAILTNNEEVAIVGGILTIGMTATYVSTMSVIPEGPRLVIASILGLIAFVGGTFWAIYVKAAGNPAAVALPSQVPSASASTEKFVQSASAGASSDAQAATKS